MITKYEFHKLAEIYPLASEQEFNLLTSSIGDSGQKDLIVIYEGKILDGRNRYRACVKLGIEPKVETFEGSYEEAMKYSTELNSGRRHTTKSQQAMSAAKVVVESREGDGKKITLDRAELMFGVSKKYIGRAIKIQGESWQMSTAIFNGHLTIIHAESNIIQLKQESERTEQEKMRIENQMTNQEDESYSLEEVIDYQATNLYNKSPAELIDLLNKCRENNEH